MSKFTDKVKRSNTGPPHLVIEALAGTGKTTTLVEGLKIIKGLPTEFEPSSQQKVIWESMSHSCEAKYITFAAFNVSIKKELEYRIPKGCRAMTIHGIGNSTIRYKYKHVLQKDCVNQFRSKDILCDILNVNPRKLSEQDSELIMLTRSLASLCKTNLVNVYTMAPEKASEALGYLCGHYDIELNGSRQRVYSLVPELLKRCLDIAADGQMDFDDMIWLPVALDLQPFRSNLLLIDESQDLNCCQQALVKKAGERLIFCGDRRQAIYGFAGADSESMDRLKRELTGSLRGCEVYPLTVTRRCGRAIVEAAKKIVPTFEAHESNCDGQILHSRLEPIEGGPLCKRCEGTGRAFTAKKEDEESDGKAECRMCDGTGLVFCGSYRNQAKSGDMVLCRVNAPLVSQCFKFIKAGVKANIQGRDISEGLKKTIKKMKAKNVSELVGKLDDWRIRELKSERAKQNPSDNRMIAIQDRFDCLLCFTENVEDLKEVVTNIDKVFDDDTGGDGIKLSSIHRAKGLEADTVFLLQPEGGTVPHPMAKSQWQRDQEMNLLYVATTRARDTLVIVS